MDRPTKQIITPLSQRTVTLKEWITGREFESLNAPLLKYYKVNTTRGNIDDTQISGDVLSEMNQKALEVWVATVDGSSENVVEKILDMRLEDYQFVKAQIDELSKKK